MFEIAIWRLLIAAYALRNGQAELGEFSRTEEETSSVF